MAKSYLSDYSPTPASNTDIDGVDSTGATGRVKDGDNYTRSVMSHLAKFYDDLGAVNTVGGTATAITVTAAEGWTAYGSSVNQIDTGTILAIKTGSAATGAATLNVNGIGAKAVRRQGDSAIQANDWMANAILLLRYDAAYNGAAGAWVLLNANAFGSVGSTTPAVTASSGAITTAETTLRYFVIRLASFKFVHCEFSINISDNNTGAGRVLLPLPFAAGLGGWLGGGGHNTSTGTHPFIVGPWDASTASIIKASDGSYPISGSAGVLVGGFSYVAA